jgi:hypothetical protein
MFASTLNPRSSRHFILQLAALGLALSTAAQQPAPVPQAAPEASQQPSNNAEAIHRNSEVKPVAKSPEKPMILKEKAWGILNEGLQKDSAEKRAHAVDILGMLPGNEKAEAPAIGALKDDKANVRLAGATSLGAMKAVHAKAALQNSLEDPEPAVVLAAANSLLLMQDDWAYEFYYAIFTGEKLANKGLIKEPLQTLKDKKKMAEIGLEEGLGFIPFAGVGYTVLKTVMKDDSSPIRVAAAKKLAQDPDPGSAEALVSAMQDKNWTVRVAALEAISHRGDKSLIPRIAGEMDAIKTSYALRQSRA